MGSAYLHRYVDVLLGSDVVFEHPESLSEVWYKKSVHDETRGVTARYSDLADVLNPGSASVENSRVTVLGADNLDQLHELYRVEEVETNLQVKAPVR